MPISDDEYSDVIDSVETTTILHAVKLVDELRGVFSDNFVQGCIPKPPEIRDRLLEFHQLGMECINQGHKDRLKEFFELSEELSMELFEAHEQIKEAWKILEKINDAMPERLFDDDEDEEG